MLDIKFIRENTDKVKQNVAFRRIKVDIDEVLELDAKRRELMQKSQELRALRNEKSSGKPTDVEIKEMRDVRVTIQKYEEELRELDEKYLDKLSRIPNMASANMPQGDGNDDHLELAVWTKEGYLDKGKLGKGNDSAKYLPKRQGLHHVDLGKALEIIDVEQSVVTSGSRFSYLLGDGVLLQYGLFELLKGKLLEEGFTPMVVPVLVKEKVLFGTSHFPEGRDQVYEIASHNVEENNKLFLVGSSEPSLFGYYMNKVIPESKLPVKMFAYTHCFRSEVGSWGNDVRGIKRVHQFDKLEMDMITHPDKSYEAMEYLRSINEWFMQQLELPYRIINKCSGDCGYNATALQYDLEGWLSTQGEFIELGSNTNATDYQARRMNIKYLDKNNNREFAHTVNDTGIPMGRMLIAILDNYQEKDGTVTIPKVLQEYMGKKAIVAKK